MKENSGSQDPIWASYGGFNSIKFHKNDFSVKKININKIKLNQLSKNFFLIYTGINKFSNNIEKDKLSKLSKNIFYLSEIYDLAKEFEYNITTKNDYDFIGSILNEYWLIKKNYQVKLLIRKLMKYTISHFSWCLWGKIIGSGGGGFLLVYCKKKYQLQLKKRLYKLPIIKFKFVTDGSKIIFKS